MLPKSALALDRGYSAPFESMGPHGGGGALARARAIARHLFAHSVVGTSARRLRGWLRRKGWA